MEKFSNYRDRGTQIAPFLPIHEHRTTFQLVYGFFIFLVRLPFFISVAGSYLLIVHWLPVGSFVRKAWLWSILGVCGVWWVDLQVEGVKRGSLARQAATKLPGPGTIIVSSYTSPLDAIYLAAIFDPVFTTTYPTTNLVERVSFPLFLWRYFTAPVLRPFLPPSALIPLPTLLAQCSNRTVLMFPEATPTNGRGILRFTSALSTTPPKTKIFPISLKYTPADITTPIPHSYVKFIWSLLSRPTHCIRVRIAETILNDELPNDQVEKGDFLLTGAGDYPENELKCNSSVCDRGAEALARIGRIKRLNLGVREKIGFVQTWQRKNRSR